MRGAITNDIFFFRFICIFYKLWNKMCYTSIQKEPFQEKTITSLGIASPQSTNPEPWP